MPYIGQGLEQGRRQLYTFTATASQTTFSASYTPGFVDVYQNGILLAPGDYTATNGTSIVLGAGAAVSDEITIIAQHTFTLADVVSSSSGGTFTGDVTMAGNLTVQGTTITVDTNTAQTLALGDADKIKLGDDGDLEIYHSGADSFIDDTGTGSIFIRSGTTYLQNAAGTKTSIQTNAGAGQTLYYNNTSKFQTTDNGALVGDGLGTEVLTILADSSGESQLRFADGTTGTAAYQGRVEYEHTAGKLNLGAGGTTQVTIDSSGNMGLGTNSPTPTASNYDSASFHISQVGSSSVGAQIRFSTGATGHTAGDGTFMAQWADSNFYITNQEANADIRFNAGGNADMVVLDGQNGNVGIGISPATSAGANYARLVIDSDSNNYPKSLEINAVNPAGPNFAISSYSDGSGSYYLLGANLSYQTNGNFAWETNGENMAGLAIDSRAGHGLTFIDSYYDGSSAYVPAEIGKVHTSIDGRADITVDATGLAGDGGVNANAFFNAKAKGYYYAGLEILSNDGHVGGWLGHYNGSSTARNIQARVGGTGINASDYLAIQADHLARVTTPNQPAFMAKGNNSAYITTSPMPFPTVEFNVGNHYNASTYTFTAPVAGRYFFHAHVGLVNGGSGNQIYPWFSVNGVQVMYSYMNFQTTWYGNAHLTCIFNLSANDTVRVTVSASGATYYNGQAETRFMGYLLG